MYPKLEGRFPQVSGIKFAFDPKKPAGKRIDPLLVRIGDEYVEKDRKYHMVTKAYLANGKKRLLLQKNSISFLAWLIDILKVFFSRRRTRNA